MSRPFLFFSYSGGDPDNDPTIERIDTALTDAGFKLFKDERDILPGQDWAVRLQESLRDCVCGVVLWTRKSAASEWVNKEAVILNKLDKYVPIELETGTMPDKLRHIQAAKLPAWDGDTGHAEWRKLIAALYGRRAAHRDLPTGTDISQSGLDRHDVEERVEVTKPNLETSGNYFRDAPDMPMMLRMSAENAAVGAGAPKAYALSVGLITFGEWNFAAQRHEAEQGPGLLPPKAVEKDRLADPVTHVNWDEAQSYVAWLNSRIGAQLYYLPSESEWMPGEHNPRKYWEWTKDIYVDQAEELEADVASLRVESGPLNPYRLVLSHHRGATMRSGFDRKMRRSDLGFRIAREMV